MQKIIIEISGGNVTAVFTNADAQIVFIDRDLINTGSFPDCEPRMPDATFENGEAHNLFTTEDMTKPYDSKADENIALQLRLLKF